jgi:hypothetical protein
MPFPFSIRYNKPLRAIITPDNQRQVLEYIQKRILQDKADNVVIRENLVTYKGSTSSSRINLMSSVDLGTFTLVSEYGKSKLLYEVSTYRSLVILFVMCVVMGIISQNWLFGLIGFFWLSGMGWLVNLAQHEDLAARIAIGRKER